MSTATFDTYTAAKRLRDAGFDERQAEAAVSMVRDAAGADREQLATKADLAELETRLMNTLATKADLNASIASVRAELGTIRWTVGLITAFLFVIGLRVFGLI